MNRRRSHTPSPLRALAESENSEDESDYRSGSASPSPPSHAGSALHAGVPELLDPLSLKLRSMRSASDSASTTDLAGAGEGAAGPTGGGAGTSTASTSPSHRAHPLRVLTVLEAGKKLFSNLKAETLKRLPVHLDDVDRDATTGQGADAEAETEWEHSPTILEEEQFGRSIRTRLKHKATTDFEHLIKVQQLGHVPPPAAVVPGAAGSGVGAPVPGHGPSASMSYGLRFSQSMQLAPLTTSSSTTATTAVSTALNAPSSSHPLGAPVPRVLRDQQQLGSTDEALAATTRQGVRGPVWCMKFSLDGKVLAAAGEDGVVRLWSLLPDAGLGEPAKLAPAPTPASAPETGQLPSITRPPTHVRASSILFGAKTALSRTRSASLAERLASQGAQSTAYSPPPSQAGALDSVWTGHARSTSQDAIKSAPTLRVQPVFRSRPFRLYAGHTGPILDLAFSKSNFLISASMDKTVRLWHLTQKECLCAFEHPDAVTSIQFHPMEDEFFLSGCLDGRIRIWSIKHKRVKYWNEVTGGAPITAVSYAREGMMAIAGTFTGDCMFYDAHELKYNTQIQVRSTRGINAKGSKITGILAFNDTQSPDDEKILITSNDSRIRIYYTRDKSLYRKYKGLDVRGSQIRAAVSRDGEYIISGSEDRYVYIWNLNDSRKGRNSLLRGARHPGMERFLASSGAVTCAIFSPVQIPDRSKYSKSNLGCILVTSDVQGRILVYQNVPPNAVPPEAPPSPLASATSPIRASALPSTTEALPRLPLMKAMRPIRAPEELGRGGMDGSMGGLDGADPLSSLSSGTSTTPRSTPLREEPLSGFGSPCRDLLEGEVEGGPARSVTPPSSRSAHRRMRSAASSISTVDISFLPRTVTKFQSSK